MQIPIYLPIYSLIVKHIDNYFNYWVESDFIGH
jgi:hypothetical protein